MERDITTQVWFGEYTKFSFGADEEDGLMDFTVCHEDEPENYEGRYWSTTLSPDEMEYLAHRMLDAVAYYRRKYGFVQEPIPDGCEPCILSQEETERQKYVDALAKSCGDRNKAAQYLNITPRTFYRMAKHYGVI